MFSAERCGLHLLCDAIGNSTLANGHGMCALVCDETCESPKRKSPRAGAHVSFSDRTHVREFDCESAASRWISPASGRSAHVATASDVDGTDMVVERRLWEAELNMVRNRRVDRYGAISPMTNCKPRSKQAFDFEARRQEGDALSQASRSLANADAPVESPPRNDHNPERVA